MLLCHRCWYVVVLLLLLLLLVLSRMDARVLLQCWRLLHTPQLA